MRANKQDTVSALCRLIQAQLQTHIATELAALDGTIPGTALVAPEPVGYWIGWRDFVMPDEAYQTPSIGIMHGERQITGGDAVGSYQVRYPVRVRIVLHEEDYGGEIGDEQGMAEMLDLYATATRIVIEERLPSAARTNGFPLINITWSNTKLDLGVETTVEGDVVAFHPLIEIEMHIDAYAYAGYGAS